MLVPLFSAAWVRGSLKNAGRNLLADACTTDKYRVAVALAFGFDRKTQARIRLCTDKLPVKRALLDPGGVFFGVEADLLGDLRLREGVSEQNLLIDLNG